MFWPLFFLLFLFFYLILIPHPLTCFIRFLTSSSDEWYLKSFAFNFQSLALRSSNLAMVPKCTSSGPSAILKVLAAAQRWARTVSEDKPPAPCTCIAMSRICKAIAGAATCTEFYQRVKWSVCDKRGERGWGYVLKIWNHEESDLGSVKLQHTVYILKLFLI